MKKNLTRILLLSLSALCLGPLAGAAVDADVIPADAKWMLHVDFSALRESPVGRELIEMAEKNANVPIAAGNIRIDVKKVLASIGSATAYGTVFSKNPDEVDGTLLIRGTPELRQIVEAVVTQATISQPDVVTELKGLPFTAYAIKGKLTVAFPSEPIVLVSRSQPQLLKAYDLFRGKGPSGAKATSSLKSMVPKNHPFIVFAASEVPNTDELFDENQPQARILKMASAASVTLGDESKHTTAAVQLVAASDEYSDKLLKIVQGMVAMVSLAQSDDKQLAEFMQSMKAERSGRTILLSFAYPDDGLIQMLHNLEDEHNQPPQPENPEAHVHHKTKAEGRVIDSWVADKDLGADTVTPQTLTTRTIENVALKNGTVVILTGEAEGGEHCRIDFVDIIPSAGGQPLHFEAENMKLRHYKVEKTPHASGGRDIMLGDRGAGSARFEFPGVDGTYTLKVRYVDENDGKGRFTVSLQDPEPSESEEESEPPAAPEAPVAPSAK